MKMKSKTNTKLKVAVQIFGNMRTFEKCAPSLMKHFLKHYDCDIFIHTWSKLDHETKTWHIRQTPNKDLDLTQLRKKIQSVYKAAKIKIETQTPKDMGVYEAPDSKTHSIYGIKSMFYSMEQTNKLRESYELQSKVTYDYVLMIRPDILLKKRLNIQKFTKPFSDDEIENAVFSAGFNNKPIINELRFVGAIDIIFFAKPQVMGKLLRDHMVMATDAHRISNLKKFRPEYLLYRQAKSQGVNFYITDYIMNGSWEILRATPKITPKKIIRLHIKKNYTNIVFLGFIQQILQFKIIIMGYSISLAIGE